jgi:uncharacterized membrane protein YgcG
MNMKTKIMAMAAGAVILLAGCGSPVQGYELASNDSVAVCTDRTTGQRVDDDRCDRNGGGIGNFFWYYLLASHLMPSYGQPVYGGSYVKPTKGRVFLGGVSKSGGKLDLTKPYKPFSTNVPKSQMKKESWFNKKWGSSSNSGSGTQQKKSGGGWGSYGNNSKSGGYSGGGSKSGGGYSGGVSGRR